MKLQFYQFVFVLFFFCLFFFFFFFFLGIHLFAEDHYSFREPNVKGMEVEKLSLLVIL